jgi:hypothetical protein
MLVVPTLHRRLPTLRQDKLEGSGVDGLRCCELGMFFFNRTKESGNTRADKEGGGVQKAGSNIRYKQYAKHTRLPYMRVSLRS